MAFSDLLTRGARAGLVAGLTVAAIFFVADLVTLAPLSTPLALGRTLFGPGFEVDVPLVNRVIGVAAMGANLLAVTVLHLIAFAALGAGATLVFDRMRWRLNLMTGALYGLVVCSAVLYAGLLVAGRHTFDGRPSFTAVLVVNLLGGAVMGACAPSRDAGEA